MNGLIDVRQVATQILGFLLLLWGLRKWAWGPVLGMLETRRQKIAGAFDEAERRKHEALELKARYEQDLRGIEAQARVRIQQAVAEGQKVAAEIKSQAQAEAQHRIARAEEEIVREREKAKEVLKESIIGLAVRSAEKILRQKLDDPAQRRLAGEFIDEVGALK
ncbi:MAG TPA: F0F1 ATP synthase subunit B [Candidatus Eisenbacteria bacterium]